MEHSRVLLDTDVIVNWLIQETETISNKELWKAPYEIIKLIEAKDLFGIISLTTLLEIRFLLRRKKKYTFHQVEADIRKLTNILDVVIPDEITLLIKYPEKILILMMYGREKSFLPTKK